MHQDIIDALNPNSDNNYPGNIDINDVSSGNRTLLGRVNILRHLHLDERSGGNIVNPLRDNGLINYKDDVTPDIQNINYVEYYSDRSTGNDNKKVNPD